MLEEDEKILKLMEIDAQFREALYIFSVNLMDVASGRLPFPDSKSAASDPKQIASARDFADFQGLKSLLNEMFLVAHQVTPERAAPRTKVARIEDILS